MQKINNVFRPSYIPNVINKILFVLRKEKRLIKKRYRTASNLLNRRMYRERLFIVFSIQIMRKEKELIIYGGFMQKRNISQRRKAGE